MATIADDSVTKVTACLANHLSFVYYIGYPVAQSVPPKYTRPRCVCLGIGPERKLLSSKSVKLD